MASLTLYISIWTALIVLGILLFPDNNLLTQSWLNVNAIYQDPVTAIPNLVQSMFKGPNGLFILGVMIASAGGGILTNYFSGGGFTLLFAIPMMIVFAMIDLFALPTVQIINSALPAEVKMIYVAVLGGLTVLTAITFMGGRS